MHRFRRVLVGLDLDPSLETLGPGGLQAAEQALKAMSVGNNAAAGQLVRQAHQEYRRYIVNAGAGRDLTVLDAEGLGRHFTSMLAESLTLLDLSLVGGLADEGGAILSQDGEVVLEGIGNHASDVFPKGAT